MVLGAASDAAVVVVAFGCGAPVVFVDAVTACVGAAVLLLETVPSCRKADAVADGSWWLSVV